MTYHPDPALGMKDYTPGASSTASTQNSAVTPLWELPLLKIVSLLKHLFHFGGGSNPMTGACKV